MSHVLSVAPLLQTTSLLVHALASGAVTRGTLEPEQLMGTHPRQVNKVHHLPHRRPQAAPSTDGELLGRTGPPPQLPPPPRSLLIHMSSARDTLRSGGQRYPRNSSQRILPSDDPPPILLVPVAHRFVVSCNLALKSRMLRAHHRLVVFSLQPNAPPPGERGKRCGDPCS